MPRDCSAPLLTSTRRFTWDGTVCASRLIWRRRKFSGSTPRAASLCARSTAFLRRPGNNLDCCTWSLILIPPPLACLDAYESTADLSYFKFACAIGDAMIARFFDAVSGGFFDAEPAADGKSLGVLSTRRKPLQDSPTPAGNPMAAIALLRLHHYTDDHSYRDKAEQTLELFAGVAEQFGIFAATYGIAVLHFLYAPVQVVVIAGTESEQTESQPTKLTGTTHAFTSVAAAAFAFNKSVLLLTANQAVAENLPPSLAATIPKLPQLGSDKSFAVLCSGASCQPPFTDASELRNALERSLKKAV